MAVRTALLMFLLRLLDLHEARLDAVLRQGLAHPVQLFQPRVRPHAHAVPGALVGQVRRLDARLEAEDRQPRLLVVGVGGVLERARLYEINVLRAFLLTARLPRALTQLLLRYRLLLPREDLVEVEFRLLRGGRRHAGAL